MSGMARRKPRIETVIVVLTACLLYFAPAALGRRGVQGAEKQNIERAVFAGTPLPVPPPQCDDVYISTISPFWAIDTYAGALHGRCVRWGSNGYTWLHHTGSGWHVLVDTPSVPCEPLGHIRGVPRRIECDLAGTR
jgi:hypothetical protein